MHFDKNLIKCFIEEAVIFMSVIVCLEIVFSSLNSNWNILFQTYFVHVKFQ